MQVTGEQAYQAIQVAVEHATNDSSLLCIHDAVSLYAKREYKYAYKRALTSLEHSIGVFHPAYQQVQVC